MSNKHQNCHFVTDATWRVAATCPARDRGFLGYYLGSSAIDPDREAPYS